MCPTVECCPTTHEEQVQLVLAGDVTVGGDHVSTHVGVDVLEGPNAIVIIAQIDLGMAGDVAFDTVRILCGSGRACLRSAGVPH